MSLYGLRAMDSQAPEVRVLLGALIHKIRTSPSAQLQLRDLSMAIIGILKVNNTLIKIKLSSIYNMYFLHNF